MCPTAKYAGDSGTAAAMATRPPASWTWTRSSPTRRDLPRPGAPTMATCRAALDGDLGPGRRPALAQRQERHAQRVEVSAAVDAAALDDLGGHEAERVARRRRLAPRAGDAEVHELDGEPAAAAGHEDVRRL